MAGPGIRAWHMAEVLADAHDVRLVTTAAAADRSGPRFVVESVDVTSAAAVGEWADVVVTHPGILRTHAAVAAGTAALVVDLYDPFHLENLEPGAASSPDRHANFTHLNSVINDALVRGDFFLCASERQRDFWLGSLTALGRVNPDTYDADPTFAGLVAVAPFGIDANPPQHSRSVMRGVIPGIGVGDPIVLWAGGVYDWFDPLTLVEAISVVARSVPDVRLVFMGMVHPNPAIPPMQMAQKVRERADRLGLTGQHVFFNDRWVPYDERANYLLEADVGVSTHGMHIETAFAFRTRILDYLWAGLPIVVSRGDVFGDLATSEGLGIAVEPGRVDDLAKALSALLRDESGRAQCRENARRIAPSFEWPAVLEPLLAFCADPRVAADRRVVDSAQPSPDPAMRVDPSPPPRGGRLRARLRRS